MRKKLFAVIMAAVMAVSLAACGGNSAGAGTDASNGSDTTDSSAAVEYVPLEPGAPVAKTDMKIGLICAGNEENGYNASHIAGLTKACEDLSLDTATQLIIKKDIPEDESCYNAAKELVDEGCGIIFSDSYGHQNYMQTAAVEFPDVVFVACTGDTAAATGLTNFKNIFPHEFEARYVSGVAAGKKLAALMDEDPSLDPYVGYVGSFPYAEIVSGMTAFFLGIRSVVPEAHMDVEYIGYEHDLADKTADANAANSLISNGCVIIGQYDDSTEVASAVEAANQSGQKVYCVGYNKDLRDVAPNAALTSAMNNWSVLYENMISCMIEGEVIPVDYSVGADQNAVMISELGAACAEGTQEAVDAAWAGIKDGSLQVFDTTTFTCQASDDDSYVVDDNGVLLSAYGLDADGDLINDYGEAVIDGAFVESELRSAPYFSLSIDGITSLA